MKPLRALTSLRFAAAMMAFACPAPVVHQIAYVFGTGYAGVGLFFLLSGFILTHTYHATFRAGVTAVSLREFYIARFARIYPIHLVAIVLGVIALMAIGSDVDTWNCSHAQQAIQVALQVLLLQAWFPVVGIFFGANALAWRISVEGLFYAAFPPIAFLGARYIARLERVDILEWSSC